MRWYMYVKSGMIKCTVESQLDVKKPAPSCTLKSEYGALVDALEMFHLELRSSHADSLTSVSASQHHATRHVVKFATVGPFDLFSRSTA
jgi:hypothetical protein